MNAKDSTLRNTQAANKKLAKMKDEIRDLKRRVKVLEWLVKQLAKGMK